MAKMVLLCTKDRDPNLSFAQNFETLSQRLTPDNISPNQPRIIQDDGIAIGIFNPSSSLPVKNLSVCMGNLIQPHEDWGDPLAEVPEGTYALFRCDKHSIELVSDILATRTIWYVQTENTFIASTSQRAILFFLKGFEPNRDVYPWMLSSGTLGPGLSWDSRIKCLEGNARLVLDRSTWKATIHREPVAFAPSDIPDTQHEDRLRKAMSDVFENIGLDNSRWILTLSGGIDSRAILLFLENRKDLKCITWGLKSSLQDKKNDSTIAARIAKHFGLEHEFFETDLSDDPFESILDKFLITGEGRVDHIAGYMDGFRIWKFLFESDQEGILRGDEAFGNLPIAAPSGVYRNVWLDLLSDFDNLDSIVDVIGEYHQSLPSSFAKKETENLERWRDRLSAQFEIPVIFASLNDIKLSYVEIINPFLSRKIVQQVRQLPDHLRTDKKLFKKIVNSGNPSIPYAKHRAVAFTKDCLKQQKVVDFITGELNSDHAKNILPEALIQFICQNMNTSNGRIHTKLPLLHRILRPLIPRRVRLWRYTRVVKHNLDLNTLGFRACLISKMTKLLSEDAKALS